MLIFFVVDDFVISTMLSVVANSVRLVEDLDVVTLVIPDVVAARSIVDDADGDADLALAAVPVTSPLAWFFVVGDDAVVSVSLEVVPSVDLVSVVILTPVDGFPAVVALVFDEVVDGVADVTFCVVFIISVLDGCLVVVSSIGVDPVAFGVDVDRVVTVEGDIDVVTSVAADVFAALFTVECAVGV